MFSFLRRPGLRSLSPAICYALEDEGLPPGTDLSSLGLVESSGTYAGRRVTHFRVVDPKRVADMPARLTYRSLDAHLELVVRAGYVESDGTVIVNRARPPTVETRHGPSPDPRVPTRERANRAEHADDERFVFPEARS